MKNWSTTRDFLIGIVPPVKTESYTPIPHTVFLDEIKEAVESKGHKITEERYLHAANGNIISGVYKISDDRDMDLMPSITFTNSYNKMVKASIRCSALVLVCKNGMMGATEHGSYTRKHTGKALEEFRKRLDAAVGSIDAEFQRLIKNKEEMKEIKITKKIIAQLVGDMYINEQMITSNQLSLLKEEILHPTLFKENSLWDFYNNVTGSLRENHPMNYTNQHIKFHAYISDKFNLTGCRGLYKEDDAQCS